MNKMFIIFLIKLCIMFVLTNELYELMSKKINSYIKHGMLISLPKSDILFLPHTVASL